MPRTSDKELYRRKLPQLINLHCNLIRFPSDSGAIHTLFFDSDSDPDSPAEFGFAPELILGIAEELQRVENTRYFAPRTRFPKSIEWRENLCVRSYLFAHDILLTFRVRYCRY